MKYKVHTSYIDTTGSVVPAGEYDETQIDLAIARARSLVTLASANVKVTETNSYKATDIYVDPVVNPEVKVVNMNPTMTTTTVEKIKINSANKDTLLEIKYVGKAMADKVIQARSTQRFDTYAELNSRVPLPKNVKWEDVSVIDFEPIKVNTNENTLIFN